MNNIIGNAVKFTDSGRISITACIKNDFLQISITDTGPGIPEDKLQSIFDAFEQADNSISGRYGGTGLGLAITRNLVELHGGTISVSSKLGTGSCFTITLPVSEYDNDNTAGSREISYKNILSIPVREEALLMKENQNPGSRGIRILVVDDEAINLQIIHNILSSSNFQITCSQNGNESLDLILGNEKFDLVLLDIMMPQISGFEVCRSIRKKYTLTELPVLLITAKYNPETVIEGFESGANDYLHKPFNNNELLARVNTLIKLKQTAELAVSAELYFLQSQIKPHFLYNTLNTINSFIRTDPEKARELLIELSNYLYESFHFCSMEKAQPPKRHKNVSLYLNCPCWKACRIKPIQGFHLI